MGAAGGLLGGIGEDGVHGLHGGEAEDVVRRRIIDAVHQRDEELVGFGFVFLKRILLPLGAELDALAEGVHRVEVFLPFLVNSVEHDVAFEVVEVLGIFRINFALVGFVNLSGDEGDVAFDVSGFELRRIQGEVEREGHVGPVEHFDEVRLSVVTFLREVADLSFDHAVDDFHD